MTHDQTPGWRTLDIFREMTPQSVDALEADLVPEQFEDGAVILRQGDAGDEMFLLDEGMVRVRIRDGETVVFETQLRAPAVFGEMALVTHAPRTATVLAEGPAHCKRLDRDHFNNLVARHPMVAVFITEAVGRRLLETDGIRSVGKYVVTGRIGSGGAATVFEAMQPELGQTVALKMLSHSLVMHPGFAEQFAREARLVAGLRHDHVVQVLDTEHAYGTHFIVMERLRGSLLEDLVSSGVKLDDETLRQVLIEVLEALQFAHDRDLLHRDIKPSNVFFTASRRAKILDFGIAVHLEESRDGKGERLGTPYYMSPEQILNRALDGRTDLYSTGIMAYELATGQVPYNAATVRDLMLCHLKQRLPDPRLLAPKLPSDIEHFIRKATAKHPDDRFASCGEAAAWLRLAAELPMVRQVDLVQVAIAYHPSRKGVVAEALAELYERLGPLSGVRIVRSRADDDPASG